MNTTRIVIVAAAFGAIGWLVYPQEQDLEPAAGLALKSEFALFSSAQAAVAAPPVVKAGSLPLKLATNLRQELARPEAEAAVEAAQAPVSKGPVMLGLLGQSRALGKSGDLFPAVSWVEAPPPPPPPPPPAPVIPVAPPLPFRFVGKVEEEGGKTIFFLSAGTSVISARVGDAIDSLYRLDRFENGSLIFIYQPLQAQQPLPIGVTP